MRIQPVRIKHRKRAFARCHPQLVRGIGVRQKLAGSRAEGFDIAERHKYPGLAGPDQVALPIEIISYQSGAS